MATTNLDHADLDAAAGGALVRENVMDRVWAIDGFPLAFQDRLQGATTGHRYAEFNTDELGAPATDNAVVDGADIDQDDSSIGDRQGNHCQNSVKCVRVSTRADDSNSIGNQGSLAYQVSQAQRRLRRDVEAQMLTNQASVQDDGDTVAGVSGGLAAWIKTNTSFGATGSAGGFNTTTKVVDAHTAGTARAMTETELRDRLEQIWTGGGNTDELHGRGPVIRLMSEYMFTSTARIATQQNQVSNPGEAMEAVGSVNVFVSDFGQVVNMVANRLMQAKATDTSDLFYLDYDYLHHCFMTRWNVRPLAKTGLSEKRMVHVDYCLLPTNEKAQGMTADIDETVVMTLS